VLLGIVGALVAIPVAAAIQLLLREITIRRLDRGRAGLASARSGWRA
jgi:predicted PurR-regulated permease PerM